MFKVCHVYKATSANSGPYSELNLNSIKPNFKQLPLTWQIIKPHCVSCKGTKYSFKALYGTSSSPVLLEGALDIELNIILTCPTLNPSRIFEQVLGDSGM